MTSLCRLCQTGSCHHYANKALEEVHLPSLELPSPELRPPPVTSCCRDKKREAGQIRNAEVTCMMHRPASPPSTLTSASTPSPALSPPTSTILSLPSEVWKSKACFSSFEFYKCGLQYTNISLHPGHWLGESERRDQVLFVRYSL